MAVEVGESPAGPDRTAGSQSRSTEAKWPDIEPFLKWAAVAYALGFGTIMYHTWSLGIPVIQLIDPINIWVGLPLAGVAFFLDKLYTMLKKATIHFSDRAKALREERKYFEGSNVDLLHLVQKTVDAVSSGMSVVLPVLGPLAPLVKVLYSAAANYWLAQIPIATFKSTAVSEEQRKALLKWTSRVLFWDQIFGEALRLANFVLMICIVVPAACLIYIAAVYPGAPQTVGGGRPLPVELILSEETLPKTPIFARWLPNAEVAVQGYPTPKIEGKKNLVVPVTLYFRTDHEIYVRKDRGPIVSLSDHAVEGIVFP
jgi:hypothetical protein